MSAMLVRLSVRFPRVFAEFEGVCDSLARRYREPFVPLVESVGFLSRRFARRCGCGMFRRLAALRIDPQGTEAGSGHGVSHENHEINGEVAKRLGNGLQNRHTRVRIPSSPQKQGVSCGGHTKQGTCGMEPGYPPKTKHPGRSRRQPGP